MSSVFSTEWLQVFYVVFFQTNHICTSNSSAFDGWITMQWKSRAICPSCSWLPDFLKSLNKYSTFLLLCRLRYFVPFFRLRVPFRMIQHSPEYLYSLTISVGPLFSIDLISSLFSGFPLLERLHHLSMTNTADSCGLSLNVNHCSCFMLGQLT